MMKHAWEGYRRYAWGQDELCPHSQSGKNMLGFKPLGLTPIDALDTLWLMDMKEEFGAAADYVVNEVDFNQDTIVSLFETNIRVLGGLLSAYALSADRRLLDKAVDMADRFMANFKDDEAFPMNSLNLRKQDEDDSKGTYPMKPYGFSYTPRRQSFSLAQLGTFSLEFGYLSRLTHNPVYEQKAIAIIERLNRMETAIPGLFPSSIYSGSNSQPMEMFSLAGDADSFYEYLLKYWLFTGKQDELHHGMYAKAVAAIQENLITEVDQQKYVISRAFGGQVMQMDHLACFAPGMLGLGAINEGDKELLKLAEELTESCFRSYHEQEHGVGCETVSVPSLRPVRNGSHYILRPEVIESIFYMWRFTKDPKYRRWGWEIAQNIEATCKVATGGYSGVKSVSQTPVQHNDVQESFFLAETIKYLYLMFSEDDLVPLDKWVFNTEAHPFPIQKSS